jgi:CheY-like chemotaxis protein
VGGSETAPAPPHRLILVVEDDDAIRALVAEVVAEEPGVHVFSALDGAQALAALQKVRPDVVLLDMGLPGIGGEEVCRRLKADPATAGVPVVGFSAGVNAAAARAAGCDDFVAKPFELEELTAGSGAGSGRAQRAMRPSTAPTRSSTSNGFASQAAAPRSRARSARRSAQVALMSRIGRSPVSRRSSWAARKTGASTPGSTSPMRRRIGSWSSTTSTRRRLLTTGCVPRP